MWSQHFDLRLVSVNRSGGVSQLDCRGGNLDDVELVGERLNHRAHVLKIAGEQPLAHRCLRQLQPSRLEIGDRWHDRDLDLLLGQELDIFSSARRVTGCRRHSLARLSERDRCPGAAGASRTADAVHIALGLGREVVVEHVRQMLDVEPARGDVGGDQQIALGGAELVHHRVALPNSCTMPP